MRKQSKAELLYESEKCEKLFDEAWVIFPKYNTSQSQDAAEWIFDRLVTSRLSQKSCDDLFEMIYAGLT